MADEIERKFLLANDAWTREVTARRHLCQFYLAATGPASVRVRITDHARATLTIKSAEPGLRRSEFEYAIPLEDARAMLPLAAGTVIAKERHIVLAGDLKWEIDVFHGVHEGLVIAEIELPATDQSFVRPDWLGEEVTGDPGYYNAELARRTVANR